MRSRATAKKWKFTVGALFAACASTAPTVALADGASGTSLEWGGDVVARPVRLSRDPLIIEAVVDTDTSFGVNYSSPVRLVIERLSPWRRTVFDGSMSIHQEDGRLVHRAEWSMLDVDGRARPGKYMFTLVTSSRRGFSPSSSSLRVDVWPSAVKRLPESPFDVESKPDIEIVIIGRQRVIPTTREGERHESK